MLCEFNLFRHCATLIFTPFLILDVSRRFFYCFYVSCFYPHSKVSVSKHILFHSKKFSIFQKLENLILFWGPSFNLKILLILEKGNKLTFYRSHSFTDQNLKLFHCVQNKSCPIIILKRIWMSVSNQFSSF